ncbi:MAG TPA: hypothetical protein VGG46_08550 [Terriglobales bacterium]|jgi:hypothetical protein
MTDLQDVKYAIERVEHAIDRRSTSAALIFYVLIGVFLFSLPGKAWHSKWRYMTTYGVGSENVQVDSEPHDCDFLAAPMGEKYCHYEQVVHTLRWATSTTGYPIESTDDGKTWSVFTPSPGAQVPKENTVEYLSATWEKKAD